jgi:hypothetical protein
MRHPETLAWQQYTKRLKKLWEVNLQQSEAKKGENEAEPAF